MSVLDWVRCCEGVFLNHGNKPSSFGVVLFVDFATPKVFAPSLIGLFFPHLQMAFAFTDLSLDLILRI